MSVLHADPVRDVDQLAGGVRSLHVIGHLLFAHARGAGAVRADPLDVGLVRQDVALQRTAAGAFVRAVGAGELQGGGGLCGGAAPYWRRHSKPSGVGRVPGWGPTRPDLELGKVNLGFFWSGHDGSGGNGSGRDDDRCLHRGRVHCRSSAAVVTRSEVEYTKGAFRFFFIHYIVGVDGRGGLGRGGWGRGRHWLHHGHGRVTAPRAPGQSDPRAVGFRRRGPRCLLQRRRQRALRVVRPGGGGDGCGGEPGRRERPRGGRDSPGLHV